MRGAQSVASVEMFAPTPPVEALKYPPSSRSSLRETQNKDRREMALGTRVPAWEWSSSFCFTRKENQHCLQNALLKLYVKDKPCRGLDANVTM